MISLCFVVYMKAGGDKRKRRKVLVTVLAAVGILAVGTGFLATQFTGRIRTAVVYPAPNVAAVAIDFPDRVTPDGITTQSSFVNQEPGDTYQFPDEYRPLTDYPPESIEETAFAFRFLPVRTEIYEVTRAAGEKVRCKIVIYGDGRSVTSYLET